MIEQILGLVDDFIEAYTQEPENASPVDVLCTVRGAILELSRSAA